MSMTADEFISTLVFNDAGLIPVIVQEHSSHAVLMMAWMNDESIRQTFQTKKATYWSRSRNQLWVKGETSGNTQDVVSLAFDCDRDAVLMTVNQHGPACHTGTQTCFDDNTIVLS
jgi:phosphoribosyl-AMP cyclohydrolase